MSEARSTCHDGSCSRLIYNAIESVALDHGLMMSSFAAVALCEEGAKVFGHTNTSGYGQAVIALLEEAAKRKLDSCITCNAHAAAAKAALEVYKREFFGRKGAAR